MDRSGNHLATESASDIRKYHWRDFVWIWAGALILLCVIAFREPLWFLSPLRWILGLMYVLYVPGYCLTVTLFPRAEDLDAIERFGLNIGMSIAIVPLLALLLDKLPWGISLWPILLGEFGVLGLFTAVALLRRARISIEEAYLPGFTWAPRSWWRSLPRRDRRVFMIGTTALLLAIVSGTWILLVPSPADLMTGFYILGQNGLAEAYPHQAKVSEELSVRMGIVNRELEEHQYRVEVWVEDTWQAGQRELVAQTGPITLPRLRGFEAPLTWAMPWAGRDQRVDFLLYIDDRPDPYRQLKLWVNVDQAEAP